MATNFSFHPALKMDVNVPATLNFAEPFVQQIQKILESAGSGLQDRDGEVTVSGQAVAAILMVAGLEMVRGLPKLTLYGFGQEISRLGMLNLSDYRHNDVRVRRSEIPQGEAFAGYTVLDGSGRGMTPEQIGEIAAMFNTSGRDIRVVNAGVGQVDFAHPEIGMSDKLIATGLTVADWASRRVLYLPAGAGLASAVQAVTIHGLSESWPRVIRLNKGADGGFHVEEIVDPQDMRQWGTMVVGKWADDKTDEALIRLSKVFTSNPIHFRRDGNVIEFYTDEGTIATIRVSSAE